MSDFLLSRTERIHAVPVISVMLRWTAPLLGDPRRSKQEPDLQLPDLERPGTGTPIRPYEVNFVMDGGPTNMRIGRYLISFPLILALGRDLAKEAEGTQDRLV